MSIFLFLKFLLYWESSVQKMTSLAEFAFSSARKVVTEERRESGWSFRSLTTVAKLSARDFTVLSSTAVSLAISAGFLSSAKLYIFSTTDLISAMPSSILVVRQVILLGLIEEIGSATRLHRKDVRELSVAVFVRVVVVIVVAVVVLDVVVVLEVVVVVTVVMV